MDDLGKLKSCMLQCGICQSGNGWKWLSGGKSKGSTSNIIGHMKEKHQPVWSNAVRADLAALGKGQEEQNDDTSSAQSLAPIAEQPVRIYSPLSIAYFAYYMRLN